MVIPLTVVSKGLELDHVLGVVDCPPRAWTFHSGLASRLPLDLVGDPRCPVAERIKARRLLSNHPPAKPGDGYSSVALPRPAATATAADLDENPLIRPAEDNLWLWDQTEFGKETMIDEFRGKA